MPSAGSESSAEPPPKKEDHPVALVQAADQFQHATGDALAGVVGHRMGGFHHLDATALRAVAVRRHYRALDLALPVLLHHFGHGSGGLAGTDDDGAPAAIFRQVVGQHLVGMAGCHRGIEQLGEKARGSVLMTGSEFLVVVPPVGPAVAASSTLPFRSTRAGGNWGMEARRPDAEAVNLPAGRSLPLPRLVGGEGKRAAANTGVRRPFLSRALRKGVRRSARGDGPRGLRITRRGSEVGHVLQALDQRRVVPVTAADGRAGAEHLLGVGGVEAGSGSARGRRPGQV